MNKELLLFGLFLLCFSLIIAFPADLTKKERAVDVDCYDKKNNKINDVSCEEIQKSYFGIKYGNIINLIIESLVGTFFIIGIYIIIIGILLPPDLI